MSFTGVSRREPRARTESPGEPRRRLRAALRLAALTAGIGALFLLVALRSGLSARGVHDAIDGMGPLAPLAFVLVSTGLTVACVPGPLLAAASGLLFGTALGTPTAIVSATAGACAAFAVSRRFGAGAVDELSGHRVRRAQGWIEQRGFVAVLYARILPAVPFNVVNYAAGLTRVRIAAFAAATALGCAPRAFAYVALGGNFGDLSSPTAVVAIGVLVAMGAAGLVIVARDVRARR
jgi:uncharacterized membrane protein YdjX (TVP38/TMEM64 family)